MRRKRRRRTRRWSIEPGEKGEEEEKGTGHPCRCSKAALMEYWLLTCVNLLTVNLRCLVAQLITSVNLQCCILFVQKD